MRSERIRDSVSAVGGRPASRDLNPAQGFTKCVLTSPTWRKGTYKCYLLKIPIPGSRQPECMGMGGQTAFSMNFQGKPDLKEILGTPDGSPTYSKRMRSLGLGKVEVCSEPQGTHLRFQLSDSTGLALCCLLFLQQ